MRGAWHWLVLALVAGCGGKQAPPPVIETQEADLRPRPAPSEDPSTPIVEPTVVATDAGSKPPVATSGTEVTLLEPGSEPRRELRHVFAKGAKQKLKLDAKTTVSGVSVPIPAITLTGPMETEVTKLDSDNAHFKLTGGPFKTGTAGGGGGQLAGAMGSLLGSGAPQKIAGNGILDARGFVKEFNLTEGAGPDGSAPVETGDPFPAEPVGVGARWEVKAILQEKEGPVQQVTTYTLLKADKKSVVTQMTRVQTPMDPNTEGGNAESSGELTFQIGGVYPTGKITMSRKMSLGLGGGFGPSSVQLTSEMTIGKR